MGRSKSNETTIHNATSTSVSLRTTIPEYIVDKLDLDPKHRIIWDINYEEGVWVAKFSKKPTSSVHRSKAKSK